MTPSAIVTDELGSIDLILRDRLIEHVHLRGTSGMFWLLQTTIALFFKTFGGGNCG